MTDRLLYFPNIDIPKNAWTIKALLYWDNVGIIVPQQYIKSPERYDEFTRSLLGSDLVEQVFPYNYIYNVPNFDLGFTRLTQGIYFNLPQKQLAFQIGDVTQIHFQKFGENLLDHLIAIGIARRMDWEWYEVERATANLLMRYLATIIGKTGDFTPATDQITYMPAHFGISKTKARQKLIEDLMPYPIDMNLTLLRRFKDKYYDELKSLRRLIEQVAIEISLIKNKKIAEEKLDLKIEEIIDRKDKIFNELNTFNFKKVVFGTLFGLGGAMYGLSQNNHPLAAFGFGNAIYSALQGYDKSDVIARDYSYLALIDKKIVKK